MQKGNVIADNTAILPASDVTIELYKDDSMILSSKNVKNSEKVSVNEGEQSEITFDLSKNNCNIVVTDWGYSYSTCYNWLKFDPQFFICIKAHTRNYPNVRRFFHICDSP